MHTSRSRLWQFWNICDLLSTCTWFCFRSAAPSGVHCCNSRWNDRKPTGPRAVRAVPAGYHTRGAREQGRDRQGQQPTSRPGCQRQLLLEEGRVVVGRDPVIIYLLCSLDSSAFAATAVLKYLTERNERCQATYMYLEHWFEPVCNKIINLWWNWVYEIWKARMFL